MKEIDLLIVGLGIAGINLSFIAKKNGLSCMHIHRQSKGESTKVAAGLINPITGRRFVKSWNIEEIFPFAKEHYNEMEIKFSKSFTENINILRTFSNITEENTWLSKSSDPFLNQFLLDKLVFNKRAYAQKLQLTELMGELNNCLRVKLADIQHVYIKYLKDKGEVINERFDMESLEINGEHIIYQNVKAKNIVFAEGWRSIYNPLWNDLPFSPSKGELFIVHAPDLKLVSAFKNSMFITPLGNDLYWVGATYEWRNFDPELGEKMKPKLLKHLENTVLTNYEIKQHLTGIRPSTKDRRPIIGPHQNHKNIFLFNGMGTKGSSLSPFYANKLVEHIKFKNEIPFEVSTNRFYS